MTLGGGLRAWGSSLVRWTPVWLPFLVALQFAGGGLVPALRESARLDREEALVHGRVSELEADRAAIERDRERLVSPIWRERVRRSLFDPERPALTLAEAER